EILLFRNGTSKVGPACLFASCSLSRRIAIRLAFWLVFAIRYPRHMNSTSPKSRPELQEISGGLVIFLLSASGYYTSGSDKLALLSRAQCSHDFRGSAYSCLPALDDQIAPERAAAPLRMILFVLGMRRG